MLTKFNYTGLQNLKKAETLGQKHTLLIVRVDLNTNLNSVPFLLILFSIKIEFISVPKLKKSS